MKKSHKGLIILMTPFLLGFLLGFLVGGGCSRKKAEPAVSKAETEPATAQDVTPAAVDDEPYYLESDSALDKADDSSDYYEEPQAREIIYSGRRLSYAKLFDDLNEDHLEVAKSVGLSSPPESKDEADLKSKSLVKITDSEYYLVDELRYSVPFLTKGAAKELDNIAKAFSDSLKAKKLLDYKLVVSSVLRTEADVEKLRRSGNPNASENSAHCYGTTFDITYTRFYREDESKEFMQPYELTKVLAEVLRDEKNAGRCLVKYERKEHCFHITSRLR